VRERSIQPSISLMRLRATRDRQRSLLIVSLFDQTPRDGREKIYQLWNIRFIVLQRIGTTFRRLFDELFVNLLSPGPILANPSHARLASLAKKEASNGVSPPMVAPPNAARAERSEASMRHTS
jgi:hypothetical protein